MRYFRCLCAAAAAAVLLCSCGNGGGEDTEETAAGKSDWRNSIEYEGSFYVNENTKLLYALDRGSITLWDNGGNGEILQVLRYDSSVTDAMEHFERMDINGDGSSDIRIIYESGERNRYNLWLWNDEQAQYNMCRLYRDIYDPELTEDNKIIGFESKGVFGNVEKTYAFNEKMTLEVKKSVVTDADEVASRISAGLSLGEVRRAEGNATVDKRVCRAYIAENNGSSSYIACNDDGEWYADTGAVGFYRCVKHDGTVFSVGEYTGDEKLVGETAAKLKDSDIRITHKADGVMNGKAAKCYTVEYSGGSFYIIVPDGGVWYFSEDNENYRVLSSGNAALGEPVEGAFRAE